MNRINIRVPGALRLGLAIAGLCVLGAASAQSTRVIVAFKPGAAAMARAAVTAARGSVRLEIPRLNAVAAELPAAAVRALQASPHIAFVEQGHMVQADQLPDTYPANPMVCIIDSGYDLQHEDLRGNAAGGGYDAGTGGWFTDENSHGTHVAGTIAAVNNSGVGVVGVNSNSKLRLHIVKVFGANGWAYSSTLAGAVNQCASAGANVVSMSLGGALPSRLEIMAFNALQAQGIMAAAAAGNAGNSTMSYPAGYPSVN
ncbi:MAG: S8 family serine peptidase [Telluria sp.]